MRNKLIVIILLLLSFLLHLYQHNISFFRIYQVDFFIIYSVLSVIFFKSFIPLFLSLLAGLLQDSFSGSIIGINALSKFILAYFCLLITNRIDIRIKGILLGLFMVACIIDYAIIATIGKWFNLFVNVLPLHKLLLKFIITSFAGYILYIVIKSFTETMHLEYEEY
ncbi:MAG: hypothetical protein A2Y62_19135 [Candidatus Fischerbacteria bacterium RBG_13_37_8]|uniref:Uncharacterized protein n=1 Tax=Candidatus Fischerbacteria bacterium RBG_13_37_8 TaxID=1817863 RepID=A0A1F5VRH2_9BACT|nr:MAG: hypothetical protein A2Y62_19135 [Candidatus Fischerbacteria bacterium RBG_13_37_8]